MTDKFRPPTDLERAFLRVVTRGYEVLAAQVQSCAISDYDKTGYYDVRVLDGEPMAPVPTGPIMGPLLDLSGSDAPRPALEQIGEPIAF